MQSSLDSVNSILMPNQNLGLLGSLLFEVENELQLPHPESGNDATPEVLVARLKRATVTLAKSHGIALTTTSTGPSTTWNKLR